MPAVKELLPLLARGTEADQGRPVPREPVDGVDLAGYARIAAEIAGGARPRAEVLAAHGLDEARYLAIETTWLLRLAAAALRRDLDLLAVHERAQADAHAALAPASPERPLEDYAALCAQMEAGQDPREVLASAGLSLGAWGHLQRAWTARIASSADVAAAFEAHRRARAGR
ncbi:hypothetical protein [Sorangium sp. So ce406]|uniref:hypothetical protein n=1 Tax=Sorangium sp. So ce406 TaxID=3133311 RepID=UPI003F5C9DE5